MKLILAESRYLRYFSFFVLYLAQGFPFGLVNTAVAGYLAEHGATPAELGYFALAQDRMFGLFNELNDDDRYDIECTVETVTGSLISQRVCQPEFLRKTI